MGSIVLIVAALIAFGLSFISPRDAIWAFALTFFSPSITRQLHRSA
jgi:hypothetical protein